MALSRVGGAKGGNNTDQTDLVITLPALQENDVVWAFSFFSEAGDSETSKIQDAGWTELIPNVLTNNGGGGAFENSRLYRKVMGATPDTTFTSRGGSYNTTNGSMGGSWIVECWRGVDTTTPEDATPTYHQNNNGTPDGNVNPNSPSITTATANAVVISFAGMIDNAGQTFTSGPSGYTNFDTQGNAGSTFGSLVASASKVISSPGAEDPGAFSGSTMTYWNAVSVAIRPAASTAVGTVFRSPVIRAARNVGRILLPAMLVVPTLHQVLHYAGSAPGVS